MSTDEGDWGHPISVSPFCSRKAERTKGNLESDNVMMLRVAGSIH